MATILLLSGPNLNLLGEREPELYGTDDARRAASALARETAAKLGHELEHVQSNHEGDARSTRSTARAAGARRSCCNPGAFTHYAYALTDALAAFDGVKIELHLSNPHAREAWRHTSVIAPVVDGTIAGLRPTGLPPRGRSGRRRCWRSDMTRLDRRRSPPLDVARAARPAARALAAAGIDALLVTQLAERALPHRASPARPRCCSSRADDALFVTDGRYRDAVRGAARRGRRRRPHRDRR